MNKISQKLKIFLFKIESIEKKYKKIFYYAPLIFLSITTLNTRKELTSVTSELVDVKLKFAELKQINTTLIEKVAYYNQDFKYFPLPTWKKKKVGNEFIGSFFNQAYVNVFGHHFDYNSNNLIGKNNFQLGYSYAIAEKYRYNDSVIAFTGKHQVTRENYIDSLLRFRKIDVLKWRELRNEDTLIPGTVLKFYPYKKENK